MPTEHALDPGPPRCDYCGKVGGKPDMCRRSPGLPDVFGAHSWVDYGRPRGRPRLDDKRKPRGGFNDAEWAEVKAKAKAEGMTASAYLRALCGL